MALLWIDGYESASTDIDTHNRIYASATGTLAVENGASVATGVAISSGTAVFTTPVLVGATGSTWIIGLAFRGDHGTSINNSNIPYIAVENTDGEQMRFEFVNANDPNGKPGGSYYKIRAMRGATELASTTQRFAFGANRDDLWIYLELKVVINDTTGSISGQYQYTRKPALNGGAATALAWDAAVTGLDTQNQTSTGADRVTISMDTGNISNPVAIDDLYICDSTGAKNNDFLGKLIIEGQYVSGDGNTTDWELQGGAANTEDAWNEPLTGTEDDKRTISDTLSQVHLATVSSLATILSSSIVGVRQDVIARMETTGDLDVAHMFRKTTATAAETNGGTALNVSSTTYTGSAAVLENDPNTATDWDVADLNSYQHGVRNDG